MSPLYLHNGQLLIKDGALAASSGCCCIPPSGKYPCGCLDGYPPDTITVTFSSLTDETQTTNRKLVFTSNFGTGASGVVLSPGGCDPQDRGPIGDILLTNRGSGYAIFGRYEPTLSLSVSPGSGCVFTPNLIVHNNNRCDQKSWSLESIDVSGGEGYIDGTPINISMECPDGILGGDAPSAILYTVPTSTPPSITASVDGGADAVLSVVVSSNGGNPERWGVDSVTVENGGTNYTNGTAVSFALNGPGNTVTTATGHIVVMSPPLNDNVDLYASFEASGTGLVLSFTFVQNGGQWSLVPIIVDGGSKYVVGDQIFAIATDMMLGMGDYSVSVVDENGAVIEIETTYESLWPSGPGPIVSVVVDQRGSYFIDSGVPRIVEMVSTGSFYCTGPNAPACEADITIVPEAWPSDPNTLVLPTISATIDTTTSSQSFGQITALSLDDPGDKYLAWYSVCSLHSQLNGLPFVLTKTSPCTYAGGCENTETSIALTLFENKPLEIKLTDICDTGSGLLICPKDHQDYIYTSYFRSEYPVKTCLSLPSIASLWYGDFSGSVTITAGGSTGLQYNCPSPYECSLDTLVSDIDSTPVSFSSNCPVCAIGNISGSGTLGNIISNCKSPANFSLPVSIVVKCCDTICEQTSACNHEKFIVYFNMYYISPSSGGLLGDRTGGPVSGTSDCSSNTLTITNGALAGTADVYLSELNCTVTITFGGN